MLKQLIFVIKMFYYLYIVVFIKPCIKFDPVAPKKVDVSSIKQKSDIN